jgi:HEAT repeat protein
MVRLNWVLLAFGVLVAAGATALLAVSLVDSQSGADRGPKGSPQSDPPGVSDHEIPRPERRQPIRDPAPFNARKSKVRVGEILAELEGPPPPHGRGSLGIELCHHLRGLGSQVDPATKQKLFELLLSVGPQERRLVGEALGALDGDEESARRLLRLYREQTLPDIYAKRAIFDALGRMRVQSVVSDLATMLREDGHDESLVVEALAGIGGLASAQALIERLQRPARPELRQSIVTALGSSRDPEILEAVAQSLEDPDTQGRAALVEALGMTRDVRFAGRLRELHDKEPDGRVRHQMLRALGRFGDRDSVLLLLKTVERGGPEAGHAVSALNEVRNPQTVDALAARWNELGPRARAALLHSAARLPEPSETLMRKARDALLDVDEQTRLEAVHLLGRPACEENIRALADFVARSTSARERRAAMEALLRIRTPAAAKAVIDQVDRLPAQARADCRVRAERILERESG